MDTHYKQYILVDTIFNYILNFDFQGHVFRKVFKTHPLGAGGAGAKKMYVLDRSKDISPKWKM